MIKTGIIGFGLSSRYLQAPFFLQHAHFDLRAICTSQTIPKEDFTNVLRASKPEELIQDSDLDLLSICSPNQTHYDLAKQALLAGKHVLVEKPLTPTPAEAQELYNIAKEQGLVLAVYQNRRFDSDFLTLQKVIKSGMIGDVLSYSAHYNRYNPELNSKAWKEEASAGSGILYDLGSHLIDQAICLFGKPEGVRGKVFTERKDSKIDDAFDIQLQYQNIEVQLTSSLMRKDNGPRYVIHGTKGSFSKYGIDPQEDHLKAGIKPNDPNYGQETSDTAGILKTQLNGLELNATVDSLPGNWNLFFDNLAQSILKNESFFITKEDIIAQIELITAIKT